MSSYVNLADLCVGRWYYHAVFTVGLLNELCNSDDVEVVWQDIAKLLILAFFSLQVSQQLTAMVVLWHSFQMWNVLKSDGMCPELMSGEQVRLLHM